MADTRPAVRKLTRRFIPHLIFRMRQRGVTVSRPVDAWSIPRMVGASLAVGFAGGFLEVICRVAGPHFDPRITAYEASVNWHWPWMAPLAWVPIVAVLGLVLGVAGLVVPRLALWLAPRAWLGLVALGVILTTRGLHITSSLLLAAGVGSVLGGLVRLSAARLRWLAVVGLRAMLLVELLLFAVVGGAIFTAEARTLASLPRAAPGARNVLLIVLDTVRAKSLSLHDYARDTSPNLCRLAESGVTFQNARSPCSWTLPSHASMFTGRWPHELSAGCDAPLDGAYPTLAECLRDHGYLTAAFSANIHYANTTYGLGRGFARFEDHWNNQRVLPWEIARSSLLGSTTLEGLSFLGLRGWRVKMHRKHAPEVNHQALAWLDGRRQAGDRRPFFMFLNYMDAHGPYTLPRDVKPAYPVDFFALEAKKDQVRRFRGELSKGVGRHGRLNVRADDPAEIKALIGEIAATSRDAYDSCLIYLDGNIGMLISELRRRGELESTIVVVTSDHGEHLGEHGKFDHGVTLYRELVHVPLVLSGPGVPVGAEVKPVVSTRQLPATVCELAGIAEHPFEGPSLAAAWHEPFRSEAPFPPVLCEVEHMAHIPRAPHVPASLGPIWAVVGPTHTYIRGGPNGEELYRLEGDPNEERDLSRARDAQRALVQARRAWARFLATNVAPRYQPNARR